MDEQEIDRTLAACESALAGSVADRRAGGRAVDLRGLGFWRAVAAAKRRRGLVEQFGDRIARVDREAFVRSAPLVFPAGLGVALEAVGTGVGLAVLIVAPLLPSPWLELAYLVAAGTLIGATHGLTHYVVGSLMGMRFTHWYSLPPLKPQPGFKTDYATYLRVPARSRAWMHASGAIVSKVIPFAVAALAAGAGAQPWAVAVLLGLGVLQLVTDVTLSTKASDWKKFRREMRFAG